MVVKNLLDMEMHRIQGLPALFFDNFQKTLQKLVWKHIKFYKMTHYIISSTTRKIFTMNCQNIVKKSSNKFIYASFIRKYAKNSSNYRESLLRVCT